VRGGLAVRAPASTGGAFGGRLGSSTRDAIGSRATGKIQDRSAWVDVARSPSARRSRREANP
jgi:hypothetical protein